MKIELEITPKRIADLMVTAIEGNDQTCSWCAGIYWQTKSATPPAGPWYANPDLYAGDFQIEVHEIEDETEGAPPKIHIINQDSFKRGLRVMARDCGTAFGDFLSENEDAGTADTFLQCVVFGELVYG